MGKTSSVYVDTTKVKTALTIFDNLQEELDTIKDLSNISGVLLIPKDFYNGCNVNNLDIGSEANGVFSNYVNTINSIKKYIQDLEAVNNDGHVDNDELSNNNSGVNTTVSLGSNGIIGGIGNNASSINGLDASTSDNTMENLMNQEENVTGVTSLTGNEITNIVEDTTSAINGNNTNTENGTINGLVTDTSDQSGISQVAGSEVVEEIRDISGKVVAVAVIDNNGHKIWYQVINNNVVGDIKLINSNYSLNKPITILDNGKEININAGNYIIEQVVYNSDGSIKIIKIKCGIYSLLLHHDNNGNIIKVEYIKPQTGVFSINNKDYDMYDMYGNIIGKFGNGEYYIYETKYDQSGKVIAFRVSPNGDYEQWIYVNETTNDSEYSLVTLMQTNDKTNVSLFEKNKGLFGLLGILFVALGVTVAVKIVSNKKNKNNDNEENNDEYVYYDTPEKENNVYEELDGEDESLYQDSAISSLSTGNYPIYDVKQDENGLITEARITPDDRDDEYWVEVR